SVVRSGWAGAAALRATASPGPAKHVVAADYIPPGAAVATVNAFLTDAGRFSQSRVFFFLLFPRFSAKFLTTDPVYEKRKYVLRRTIGLARLSTSLFLPDH